VLAGVGATSELWSVVVDEAVAEEVEEVALRCRPSVDRRVLCHPFCCRSSTFEIELPGRGQEDRKKGIQNR